MEIQQNKEYKIRKYKYIRILIKRYTVKKYYENPGLFLTRPPRDRDWVHYSWPGRVW